MKIVIETIPHASQRYSTVGDWYFKMERPIPPEHGPEEEVLHIRVSKLSDWRKEMLVALHELVEVLKCKHDGVTQESVDGFDIDYEKQRAEKLADTLIPEADRALIAIDEPGDDPSAPYVKQHCLATGIERIMAAELDVNWHEYETELEALP